jgi:hypothetical protein
LPPPPPPLPLFPPFLLPPLFPFLFDEKHGVEAMTEADDNVRYLEETYAA